MLSSYFTGLQKVMQLPGFFHIDLNSNQKKFKGLVKAKLTHKKQQFNFGHVQFIQISYKNKNRFKNFRLLYE